MPLCYDACYILHHVPPPSKSANYIGSPFGIKKSRGEYIGQVAIGGLYTLIKIFIPKVILCEPTFPNITV